MKTCSSIRRDGKSCKNYAVSDSDFCGIHRKYPQKSKKAVSVPLGSVEKNQSDKAQLAELAAWVLEGEMLGLLTPDAAISKLRSIFSY